MGKEYITLTSGVVFKCVDKDIIEITSPTGLKAIFEDTGHGYRFINWSGKEIFVDYGDIIDLLTCYKIRHLDSVYSEQLVEGKVIDTFKIG